MAKPVPTAVSKGKVVVSAGKAPGKKRSAVTSTSEVLEWLLDRVDVERINPNRLAHDTLKLERMHAIMSRLGDPHRAFKSVHVAGTKGKGSTCEMTAAMLEGCGYTVGIYTSPHLVDLRERIRINRGHISEPDMVRVAQRLQEIEPEIEQAFGEATFFELITAMAFVHFAEQAVDVAVIEVGLGGRLDSTNVIVPEVAAIANISLDHMQILGSTVELIAREKAGIFKPGVAAVVSKPVPGVLEVFREVAGQVGCPLEVVGADIDLAIRFEAQAPSARAGVSGGAMGGGAMSGAVGGPHYRVTLRSKKNSFEHLVVPLRGEHQAHNCGLALAILDKLTERGFKVPEAAVTRGLASVTMPGRMELVNRDVRVMLDGAHNAESVKCVLKACSASVSYDSLVVVFGCAADKDIDGMLKELAQGADKVIFTRSINVRAAEPRELARRFTDLCGKMCQVAGDLGASMELARRAVGREDLILVTGSLYLVGEAKKLGR